MIDFLSQGWRTNGTRAIDDPVFNILDSTNHKCHNLTTMALVHLNSVKIIDF